MSDCVSGKRRVAVLLTGVPRGYRRCVGPLRFMLEECDVVYHAVIREEFATAETLEELHAEFPGIYIVVVPEGETRKALAPFVGKPVASSLIMMWHEIAYGVDKVADLGNYECVLRTRFDAFMHRQYLPEVSGGDDSVWIPEQMSWSGTNDMLCLAAPRAFRKYADTYSNLPFIVAEGIYVPEMIIARSLAMTGLVEQKLEVFFILLREVLFSGLTDTQLALLAHLHPSLSTYKLGGPDDSPEQRASRVAQIETLAQDHLFPLFETHNAGTNFYPPENDARDGKIFRWMGVHAHMNIAISRRAQGVSFLVHFHVAGWSVSGLKLLVNGVPLDLKVISTDAFGRTRLFASLKGIALRRPWSKVGFSCVTFSIPSETGENPDDHRSLSVAIGLPQIHEGDNWSNIEASR